MSNPKVILGSMMTFSSGGPEGSSSPNNSDRAPRTRTRAARATGTGTRRANPGVDGVAPRIRLTREATHADISTARGDSVSSRATRRVYKYFLTLTRDADGRAKVLRKHEFTLKARYRLPRRRVFPLRVRVVLRLRRLSLGGLAFPV